MSVSRNTTKKGKVTLFKKYDGPNSPHLRYYWYKSGTVFHRFTVYFAVTGSKDF